MVQILCTGYTSPSCTSEKHLDAVTDKLNGNIKHQLGEKILIIGEDGWSNIEDEPLIAT